MRKAQILGTIKSKAYTQYLLWALTKDIKHYDNSLLYLELYCELADKSFVEEKQKMWVEYGKIDKATTNR